MPLWSAIILTVVVGGVCGSRQRAAHLVHRVPGAHLDARDVLHVPLARARRERSAAHQLATDPALLRRSEVSRAAPSSGSTSRCSPSVCSRSSFRPSSSCGSCSTRHVGGSAPVRDRHERHCGRMGRHRDEVHSSERVRDLGRHLGARRGVHGRAVRLGTPRRGHLGQRHGLAGDHDRGVGRRRDHGRYRTGERGSCSRPCSSCGSTQVSCLPSRAMTEPSSSSSRSALCWCSRPCSTRSRDAGTEDSGDRDLEAWRRRPPSSSNSPAHSGTPRETS